MKARMRVEQPGSIEMTVTLTMTMDKWEDLSNQLAEKWPSSRLKNVISEMLIDARRVYYATPEED